MKTINLKELRNALSCWQDDYDCDDDKEQYDMFGAAIDAVSRLEAAELEIEGLKRFQELNLKIKQAMHERFTRAERERDELRAEIARRDAEAGEPVAWLNDAYLARGVLDGEAGKEDQGPGYIPVYRIPPPAVLSPEYHAAMKKLRHTLVNCNRINYCAEALQDVEKSLVLGAQPQKVVELPETYWTFDDDKHPVLDADEVIAALDAAGVKWEVKK